METQAILITCAVLLHFIIPEVSGRGVLTIRLTSFRNPLGRTYDGTCCDPSPLDDSSTCAKECDYVMRLIISGLGRANDHVFLFHRPLKYNSNSIVFEQGRSNLVLTVLFDTWPKDRHVKMNAFFYDYDDFDHTTSLVDWFETELRHGDKQASESQDTETVWGVFKEQAATGTRQSDKTKLTFEWSAICSEYDQCIQPVSSSSPEDIFPPTRVDWKTGDNQFLVGDLGANPQDFDGYDYGDAFSPVPFDTHNLHDDYSTVYGDLDEGMFSTDGYPTSKNIPWNFAKAKSLASSQHALLDSIASNGDMKETSEESTLADVIDTSYISSDTGDSDVPTDLEFSTKLFHGERNLQPPAEESSAEDTHDYVSNALSSLVTPLSRQFQKTNRRKKTGTYRKRKQYTNLIVKSKDIRKLFEQEVPMDNTNYVDGAYMKNEGKTNFAHSYINSLQHTGDDFYKDGRKLIKDDFSTNYLTPISSTLKTLYSQHMQGHRSQNTSNANSDNHWSMPQRLTWGQTETEKVVDILGTGSKVNTNFEHYPTFTPQIQLPKSNYVQSDDLIVVSPELLFPKHESWVENPFGPQYDDSVPGENYVYWSDDADYSNYDAPLNAAANGLPKTTSEGLEDYVLNNTTVQTNAMDTLNSKYNRYTNDDPEDVPNSESTYDTYESSSSTEAFRTFSKSAHQTTSKRLDDQEIISASNGLSAIPKSPSTESALHWTTYGGATVKAASDVDDEFTVFTPESHIMTSAPSLVTNVNVVLDQGDLASVPATTNTVEDIYAPTRLVYIKSEPRHVAPSKTAFSSPITDNSVADQHTVSTTKSSTEAPVTRVEIDTPSPLEYRTSYFVNKATSTSPFSSTTTANDVEKHSVSFTNPPSASPVTEVGDYFPSPFEYKSSYNPNMATSTVPSSPTTSANNVEKHSMSSAQSSNVAPAAVENVYSQRSEQEHLETSTIVSSSLPPSKDLHREDYGGLSSDDDLTDPLITRRADTFPVPEPYRRSEGSLISSSTDFSSLIMKDNSVVEHSTTEVPIVVPVTMPDSHSASPSEYRRSYQPNTVPSTTIPMPTITDKYNLDYNGISTTESSTSMPVTRNVYSQRSEQPRVATSTSDFTSSPHLTTLPMEYNGLGTGKNSIVLPITTIDYHSPAPFHRRTEESYIPPRSTIMSVLTAEEQDDFNNENVPTVNTMTSLDGYTRLMIPGVEKQELSEREMIQSDVYERQNDNLKTGEKSTPIPAVKDVTISDYHVTPAFSALIEEDNISTKPSLAKMKADTLGFDVVTHSTSTQRKAVTSGNNPSPSVITDWDELEESNIERNVEKESTGLKDTRPVFNRKQGPTDIELLYHSIKKLKAVKFQTHAPVESVLTVHPAFHKRPWHKQHETTRFPAETDPTGGFETNPFKFTSPQPTQTTPARDLEIVEKSTETTPNTRSTGVDIFDNFVVQETPEEQTLNKRDRSEHLASKFESTPAILTFHKISHLPEASESNPSLDKKTIEEKEVEKSKVIEHQQHIEIMNNPLTSEKVRVNPVGNPSSRNPSNSNGRYLQTTDPLVLVDPFSDTAVQVTSMPPLTIKSDAENRIFSSTESLTSPEGPDNTKDIKFDPDTNEAESVLLLNNDWFINRMHPDDTKANAKLQKQLLKTPSPSTSSQSISVDKDEENMVLLDTNWFISENQENLQKQLLKTPSASTSSQSISVDNDEENMGLLDTNWFISENQKNLQAGSTTKAKIEQSAGDFDALTRDKSTTGFSEDEDWLFKDNWLMSENRLEEGQPKAAKGYLRKAETFASSVPTPNINENQDFTLPNSIWFNWENSQDGTKGQATSNEPSKQTNTFKNLKSREANGKEDYFLYNEDWYVNQSPNVIEAKATIEQSLKDSTISKIVNSNLDDYKEKDLLFNNWFIGDNVQNKDKINEPATMLTSVGIQSNPVMNEEENALLSNRNLFFDGDQQREKTSEVNTEQEHDDWEDKPQYDSAITWTRADDRSVTDRKMDWGDDKGSATNSKTHTIDSSEPSTHRKIEQINEKEPEFHSNKEWLNRVGSDIDTKIGLIGIKGSDIKRQEEWVDNGNAEINKNNHLLNEHFPFVKTQDGIETKLETYSNLKLGFPPHDRMNKPVAHKWSSSKEDSNFVFENILSEQWQDVESTPVKTNSDAERATASSYQSNVDGVHSVSQLEGLKQNDIFEGMSLNIEGSTKRSEELIAEPKLTPYSSNKDGLNFEDLSLAFVNFDTTFSSLDVKIPSSKVEATPPSAIVTPPDVAVVVFPGLSDTSPTTSRRIVTTPKMALTTITNGIESVISPGVGSASPDVTGVNPSATVVSSQVTVPLPGLAAFLPGESVMFAHSTASPHDGTTMLAEGTTMPTNGTDVAPDIAIASFLDILTKLRSATTYVDPTSHIMSNASSSTLVKNESNFNLSELHNQSSFARAQNGSDTLDLMTVFMADNNLLKALVNFRKIEGPVSKYYENITNKFMDLISRHNNSLSPANLTLLHEGLRNVVLEEDAHRRGSTLEDIVSTLYPEIGEIHEDPRTGEANQNLNREDTTEVSTVTTTTSLGYESSLIVEDSDKSPLVDELVESRVTDNAAIELMTNPLNFQTTSLPYVTHNSTVSSSDSLVQSESNSTEMAMTSETASDVTALKSVMLAIVSDKPSSVEEENRQIFHKSSSEISENEFKKYSLYNDESDLPYHEPESISNFIGLYKYDDYASEPFEEAQDKNFGSELFVKNAQLWERSLKELPEHGFILHTVPASGDQTKSPRSRSYLHPFQHPTVRVSKRKPTASFRRNINQRKFRTYVDKIRHAPTVYVPQQGLFQPGILDDEDEQNGTLGDDELVTPNPGQGGLQMGLKSSKDSDNVFSRYWPAVLGVTVGTIFLVTALVTSILCRQRRLLVQRAQWTDSPQHLSEPPDTSEYASSSAASLTSDMTRSSINLV